MRHFAATEAKRYLHFVALSDELAELAHFDLKVMFVGLRTQFDLFDLNLLLLALRLMQTFCFLKLEFAVIHDSANRRLRCRRDFHQVQVSIFGHCHCFTQRNNARLLTVFIYQPNLASGDLAIDSGIFIGYVTTPTLVILMRAWSVFRNGQLNELFDGHNTHVHIATTANRDGTLFGLFGSHHSDVGQLL